jgi:hypothetical protein
MVFTLSIDVLLMGHIGSDSRVCGELSVCDEIRVVGLLPINIMVETVNLFLTSKEVLSELVAGRRGRSSISAGHS